MNDNFFARINQVVMGGFIAGFFNGILRIFLLKIDLFSWLGATVAMPADVASWLTRQSVWGAIWGMLFMLPIVKYRSNAYRGLLMGVAPLLYLCLWDWPTKDGLGYFGLAQGYALPLVHIVLVPVAWGMVAGAWLDFSGFHADSAHEHALDEGRAADLL